MSLTNKNVTPPATGLSYSDIWLAAWSRIAISVLILLGVFALGLSTLSEYVIFTCVGFFALAIVLIPPAFHRDYRLLSTWSFLVMSVFLGMTLRGIYIGLDYPDRATIEYFFTLGEPAEYFYYPSLLLLICLGFIVVGYLIGPVGSNSNFDHYDIDRQNIYIFVFFATTISILATLMYVNLTGGFDLSNITKKRSVIEAIQLSHLHRTWQSLRLIASIAMIAHLVVLVDILRTRGERSTFKICLCVFLFFLAAFPPFYASSRGIIVLYALMSLSTVYYMKQQIPWGKALLGLFTVIVVFQLMSVMRSTRDITITEAVSGVEFNVSILDRLVLNRNAVELGKTAHIVNNIPSVLDWQYGKTIAVWLTAPIPRELWNSKPLISSGPIIGTKIYGNRVAGVPPGFVAESYWNFGLVGIVFGALFFGWLMRSIDARFGPKPNSSSISVVVMYIYGLLPFGYFVMGAGFGFGLFNIIVNTMFAFAVLKFLRS